MAAFRHRDLALYRKSYGGEATVRHLTEALESRKLRPNDFSIRDLAMAMVDDGEEWVRNLASPKGGFRSVLEATNAVDTSQFTAITGQIFYNQLMAGYESPEFLWPKLVTSSSSTILNGERIAGIGEIGDEATQIPEGQSYPLVGVNEEFIDTPPTVKRGFIVPVTKEIIVSDKTGLLLERCAKGGHWMGVNKEKRVIDCVTGQTNTYKRNGVATNTYLTSGAYVNSQSNTLVDHTDVENAELLLAAITDPNTGEPFPQANLQMLVPLDLNKTALRIINATEVATVDNTAGANTQRQFSPAPGPLFSGAWKVLTNQWVKTRTSSASTWFMGEWKEAFGYISIWDILTQQMGESSEAAFTSDVIQRYRVSEMGTPFVKNPRRASKNT